MTVCDSGGGRSEVEFILSGVGHVRVICSSLETAEPHEPVTLAFGDIDTTAVVL